MGETKTEVESSPSGWTAHRKATDQRGDLHQI
jgi:hypothetical protein